MSELEHDYENQFEYNSNNNDTDNEFSDLEVYDKGDQEVDSDNEFSDLEVYDKGDQEVDSDNEFSDLEVYDKGDQEVDSDNEFSDLEVYDKGDQEVDSDNEFSDLKVYNKEIDVDNEFSDLEVYDKDDETQFEDQMVEKYTNRLYEIVSNTPTVSYEIDPNTESELNSLVDDMQQEVFDYFLKKAWNRIKKVRKGVKKFANSRIGRIARSVLSTNPAFAAAFKGIDAVKLASKVLSDPAKTYTKNFLKDGIQTINSDQSTNTPTQNALGILPGRGAEDNNDAIRNMIQVASDTNKQIADQVINNPEAGDPAKAPAIAAEEFETSIKRNTKPMINRSYRQGNFPIHRSTKMDKFPGQKAIVVGRSKKFSINNDEYVRIVRYKYQNKRK